VINTLLFKITGFILFLKLNAGNPSQSLFYKGSYTSENFFNKINTAKLRMSQKYYEKHKINNKIKK